MPINATQDDFVGQVCSNIKSDVIYITEDKLRNILTDFLKSFKKVNDWIAPFSVFLTILITFLTTDFKDFIGINKLGWEAIFYIFLIGSFLWLIISIVIIWRDYKKTKLEYLIRKIKNNEMTVVNNP